MTNKITVPSELIHRAIDAIEQVGYQDKFIDYTFVRAVKQELRAALADPVPPAGGKPDPIIAVLKGHLADGMNPMFSGGDLKHLIGLLEVGTRLQAEVDRLKDDVLSLGCIVDECGKERDALQSELTKLGDDYCKRVDELTKARELLADMRCNPKKRCAAFIADIIDVLDNQSAPADKECAHRFMSLADDPRRCADCDAVEMHDKPVVRLELVRSGLSEGLHIRVWENLGNLWPGVHMLYLGPAAQPAPVAVVMPDRKPEDPIWWHGGCPVHDYDEERGFADGWNDCLDEFTRLNSEPKP